MHFSRDNAIAALVDLVTAAPREKVVRVALSALRNLATCTTNTSPDPLGKRVINGSYFLTEMIGCGLNRSLDRMKERKWTDPDVTEGTNAVVNHV
jgi:V-type H+-transporting ATPase subunit H